MDVQGANVLLTRLRILDPRFVTPATVDEARVAAEAWAEVLADVALSDALAASVAHYRESPRQILPVDILSRSRAVDARMERARAEWLASRGLTEAKVAAMSRSDLEALIRSDRSRGVA